MQITAMNNSRLEKIYLCQAYLDEYGYRFNAVIKLSH